MGRGAAIPSSSLSNLPGKQVKGDGKMNTTAMMREKTRIHPNSVSFPVRHGNPCNDPAGRVHYVKKVVLFR
jgi:hypothetical protein